MEVCLEKQKCRYCQLIGRFRPLCVFVGVQSQSRGLIALTYLPSFVPVTGSGIFGILQKRVVVFDILQKIVELPEIIQKRSGIFVIIPK